jgi:hypothetical protein
MTATIHNPGYPPPGAPTPASKRVSAGPFQSGREPREGEDAADDWRAYLDVDADLPVFCPSGVRQ